MDSDLPGKSDGFLGCRSLNSASPSAVKRRRFRSSLTRSYALPTTGIGGHETEIIDHDLSREPGIRFRSDEYFPLCVRALGKGLKFKLREFNPSGGDRLALADTEVKSPDGRVSVAGVTERSTSRQPRTSPTSCPVPFRQPAFGCVPESTIVRAFHREIFPSNHAL